MSSGKVVVVSRFEVPAKSMLPHRRPEHEIPCGFSGDRVACHSALSGMNPFWAHSEHELHFFRERPGLLEQKVHIPFCRVTAEKRRNAPFNFEPVVYRGNFNREVRSETRTAAFQALGGSGPKLDDGDFFIGFDRLRRSVSSAKK